MPAEIGARLRVCLVGPGLNRPAKSEVPLVPFAKFPDPIRFRLEGLDNRGGEGDLCLGN